MPSTSVYASDLFAMLGRSLEGGDLRSVMLGCKAEVEDVEGDEIKLEIKDSNRIDLLSTEGIARTLMGYLGIEVGLPRYRAKPSGIDINVDPKVKNVRPYVVACCARGVSLSEETLVSYMNLQEKIHTTYGRGRKRMAIGFYDLDLIFPPVAYTLTEPDQNAFVPLGFEEEMTPAQILRDHPKGREYAHLLEGAQAYPLLVDSKGQVLSMPPIINSNTLGRITPETRNLFIEATGSDFNILSLGLNVLATSLADRRGRLQSVRLIYGKGDVRTTPDLSPKTAKLDPDRCNKLLGLRIAKGEIISLLRRARFGALSEGSHILVKIPPYRGDIMHQTDLIEEVAIMYGYDRIEPIEPRIPTVGRTDPLEDFSDALRELMVGMGFQEIMTFVLTNPENVTTKMRGRKIGYVEIENPTTRSYSIFRPDLLPSLLEFLGRNAHVPYPQMIFEVGDSVSLNENGCETQRRLCLAWADSKTNLTRLKGLMDSLMVTLGIAHDVEAHDSPHFIEGRAAKIVLNGHGIGSFGEIHPEVLESWQIPVPVLAAELEVGPLQKPRTGA